MHISSLINGTARIYRRSVCQLEGVRPSRWIANRAWHTQKDGIGGSIALRLFLNGKLHSEQNGCL